MTDFEKLSELLFPNVTETIDDLEARYPLRNLPEGARVTRFAPSPTGFLHIGGLFAALISKLNAQTTGGVFILRIEDTDKKREIEDGVSEIIKGLNAFGVEIDEGVVGFEKEKGEYGPYQQSHRAAIYHVVAKKLVAEGKARVKVLPAPDRWYGVTYKEDRPVVVEAMRAKTAAGDYPEDLWK